MSSASCAASAAGLSAAKASLELFGVPAAVPSNVGRAFTAYSFNGASMRATEVLTSSPPPLQVSSCRSDFFHRAC
ncbi:hypothetical protein WDZ92_48915, partial [Nostoc sp. NIES-2111]